jgi:hypothetical protein
MIWFPTKKKPESIMADKEESSTEIRISADLNVVRAIESLLLGVILFAANLARTAIAYFWDAGFGEHLRSDQHQPAESSWPKPSHFAHPVTFAGAMYLLDLMTTLVEQGVDAQDFSGPSRMQFALDGIYEGTLSGIVKAILPLLVFIISVAASLSLAHRLLKLSSTFSEQVRAASYGIGAFYFTGIVAFFLRSVALTMNAWPTVSEWYYWGRRSVQLLLLIMVFVCFARLVRRLGDLSLKMTVAACALSLGALAVILKALELISYWPSMQRLHH